MRRADEVKEKREDSGWHNRICYAILSVYFLVMIFLFPFYMTEGYERIGEDKYLFYRNVSLPVLGILGIVLTVALFFKREKGIILNLYRQMSVSDWFAYGYFLTVLISYLLTPYRDEAFWGAEGWYMGTVTQITFILFYFLFSRYFRCKKIWFGLWMVSAAAVLGLGILNRYSVCLIMHGEQTPVFISTLGNINWFSGYWAVIFPVGMMMYWNSDRTAEKIFAGGFCVIGFLAGVVQGSGSAFLVLAVMFLLLCALSFRENRRLYAFLELCLLFAVGCQLGRALRYIPSWENNYETAIGRILTDSGLTLWIAIPVILFYIILRFLERKREFHIGDHKAVGGIVIGGIAVLFPAYVFFRLSGIGLMGFSLSGESGVFLDDSWGNGRGAAWNVGISAFHSFDWAHKAFGIGADCFAEYCYSVPELAEQMINTFGRERLTNAHNEWITLLVNFGLTGFICYFGLFVSAVFRFLKRAAIGNSSHTTCRKMRQEPQSGCCNGISDSVFYLCAAGVLAYIVHNTVSFQQILSTPFVFMLLGMGEGMIRQEKEQE